ncbi:reactive intermediate/imine deaminase [Roseivivax halotolerans]|uniref:Reactive intermediate/imine deaminase n=1 Tax=Roseivivax halotolerans TaxID=93684 RepID=A0A1I6ALE1_9RHOB|nr:RidA family protein [Roseivivax halotolerans]SFQ69450.1 reactive intermediate/imine deaminase [Roseivivax halotolerans]
MPIKTLGGDVKLADGTNVPLSKGVRVGDFIMLSGQLGFGPGGRIVEGGIEAQTRQCIENAKALLEDAGSSLSQVAKATVWLTDTADFVAFNKVYGSYFPSKPPARSAVCSALMVPGAVVEIEFLAYQPG